MTLVEPSKTPASNRTAAVLAAVDESSAAAEVVQKALWLAASMGATLHVVRVIEVVPTIALGGSSMLIPSAARLVEMAWLDIDRLLPGEAQRDVLIKSHVAVGDPEQKIVQLAADLEADVLVIGTRNPGKVTSILLGSVAMELVRKAPCPVFVVRPKRYPHKAGADEQNDGPGGQGTSMTPGSH